MTSRNYLLTLTRSPPRTVKAMLFDSWPRDDDYNIGVVEQIRQQLTALAATSGLHLPYCCKAAAAMLEAVLGSALRPEIGADRQQRCIPARVVEMAGNAMGIAHHAYDCGSCAPGCAGDRRDPQRRPGDQPYRHGAPETTTGCSPH